MKKKSKAKEIMDNYEKAIKKIDTKYDVKEVKKPDTKELDSKIEYEKSFIEKLEFEGKELNADLINRAQERLEEALKQKQEKEEKYEKDKAKREEKLNKMSELKNSKVKLPSGREVLQTEKDKLDKVDLETKARQELNQESRRISEEITKKAEELEEKRKEWNDFKYEYEKDENGNSTGKTINDDVVKKIHEEYDNIKKELVELNELQEECTKYLEYFKEKDRVKTGNQPEGQQPAQQQPAQQPAQQQPAQQQPAQQQPAQQQPSQQQPAQQQPAQQQPAQQQPAQQQPAQQQPAQQQPAQQQPAQQQPAQQQPAQQQPAQQQPAHQQQQGEDEEDIYNDVFGDDASKNTKAEIMISRKPTINMGKTSIQIGTLRKLMRQGPAKVVKKLEKVMPNEKLSYLEVLSVNIDPILLEGIIQLKEENVISNVEMQKAIKDIASGSATKEDLNFNITYDMKDISKRAFLPWNRRHRDVLAEMAQDNKDRGIAEFKDGEEYEPNPIKRMLKRVTTKKIAEQTTKEEDRPNKKEQFSQSIKDSAQKTVFDKYIDDIYNSKEEDLDKLANDIRKLVYEKKITPSEYAGLSNGIKNQRGRLQNVEQPEQIEQEQDDERE